MVGDREGRNDVAEVNGEVPPGATMSRSSRLRPTISALSLLHHDATVTGSGHDRDVACTAVSACICVRVGKVKKDVEW